LKYSLTDEASKSEDTLVVQDTSVSDGTWHNCTVIVTGNNNVDIKLSVHDTFLE